MATLFTNRYTQQFHTFTISHIFLESPVAANAASLFKAGRQCGFFPLVRTFFFTPCPAKDPRLPMIFMLLNNLHHG